DRRPGVVCCRLGYDRPSRRHAMRCLPALLLLAPVALAAEEKPADLIRAGQLALRDDDFAKADEVGKRALALAEKEVTRDPKGAQAHFLLGGALEVLRRHREAIAAFSRVTELDPRMVEALDHRGSERFKLGDVAGALADFDHFLKVRPEFAAGHWKR